MGFIKQYSKAVIPLLQKNRSRHTHLVTHEMLSESGIPITKIKASLSQLIAKDCLHSGEISLEKDVDELYRSVMFTVDVIIIDTDRFSFLVSDYEMKLRRLKIGLSVFSGLLCFSLIMHSF